MPLTKQAVVWLVVLFPLVNLVFYLLRARP